MKKLFSDKFIAVANPSRLLYVTLVVICVSILSLFYISSQRFFIEDAKGLSDEASKKDFCSFAMNQIIKKQLSVKLMEDDLYQLVSKNEYEAMYLTGKEKIKSIWSDLDKCKIFVKGEGEPRVFDFVLTTSSDFPFYYKVQKISEHEINEGGV
jgi:hypothetical protein